jgi:hypothetical protein
METKPKAKRARWVAFGLAVGIAATWGGFGLAEGAPSNIATCTRKNGSMKVTKTGTCTGKNILDRWDHRSVTTALNGRVSTLTTEINRACVDLAVVGADPNGGGVFPSWQNAILAHTTQKAGFLYRHPECTNHLTLR